MPKDHKPDAVGATPVPQKDDIRPRSLDKTKGFKDNQQTEGRGGPLNDPGVLSPYQGADESPAYRRADSSRHSKDS